MKSQNKAYKYALIAVFFWSTVAAVFKIALLTLNPITLLFYASVSSMFILFFIIVLNKQIKDVIFYIKNNLKLVLLLALINPFLYYLVLFQAYDALPAQEAQVINYTWALMLTFLSVIFLKQKLTINDIVAGIICYFGVLIIATKGEPFSLNFSNLNGVFLALFSTVLWSMYWIINTKNKVEPIIGVFSNFIISVPIIGLYGYFTGTLQEVTELKGLFAAIYVGFFEMGITFLFWLNAMKHAQSTSKIANLIFISPFLSLIFIHLLLGEEIYYSTLFGLITIILGLIIQQLKNKFS
ncbi:DMT family transporter [Halarcobacter sp.]|uniref:DMT family transporter n=1 Tax=Halarcobacter sp. TaxID=2321133 RepID=UPI0029F5504D|nr:DMT family transporter [Halarcobacter sp.]